jgi:hypothetical protein
MPYKPAVLPPDRQSPDATIEEVMSFRKESANTVFRKMAAGIYKAHKNLDNTLITWESVYAERKACLERGRPSRPAPKTKRKAGHPPKIEDQSGVPEPPKRNPKRDDAQTASPTNGRQV